MTVMGPSACRIFGTSAAAASASARSAGKAAALIFFASSAFTPAASLSALRATSAT